MHTDQTYMYMYLFTDIHSKLDANIQMKGKCPLKPSSMRLYFPSGIKEGNTAVGANCSFAANAFHSASVTMYVHTGMCR